ncbi:uncharacterized protein METZ01_LOCUS475256, partial [marine metagenome]
YIQRAMTILKLFVQSYTGATKF